MLNLSGGIHNSVERVFLGTLIWVGIVYLLTTADATHFTAVLGFSGPLIGAVVSFFFRVNAADSGGSK